MNMRSAAINTADVLGCPHQACDMPVLCSEECRRLKNRHPLRQAMASIEWKERFGTLHDEIFGDQQFTRKEE